MDFSLKNKKLISWLAAGLVIKLVLFVVYAYSFNSHWPAGEISKGITLNTPDTKDYYQPIERLVNGEGYSLEVMSDTYPPEIKVVPWAYRMPGLLPIYGPLYILFGSEWGKFLVILLQFACELLSIFLLAKTALLFFKNATPVYICLILYVLNLFVSVYTLYSNSESFCISFFIFSVYFLFNYLKTLRYKDLLLAGLFLCWAIFFRSVIIFFLPVYILIILYSCYGDAKFLWKQAFTRLTLLLAVFFMADASWVLRNYKTFDRFIPLNDNFSAIATKQELALYKLIITWGGDIQNWNPSEGRWFIRPSDSKSRVYDPEFQETNPFSSSIFTTDYNLDSLKKLRTIYWKSFSDVKTNDSALYYRDLFVSKTGDYIQSFKKQKPLHYYFLTKLSHARTFMLIKRPYGLPFTGKNILEKSIRVLSVLYYYFILFLGFAGIFISWARAGAMPVKIFSLGVLLFIAAHSYFGYTEFRYLLPTYPIFTLYASYSVFLVISKLKTRKTIPL